MTSGQVEPEGGLISLATYEILAASTPEERSEILLRLIEAAPEGRLELPAREGSQANLDGVGLGRAALKARLARADSPPSWWDAGVRGVRLRGADLRGAKLKRADLRGADLRGADLSKADLRGARLRGADLREVAPAGADLRDAVLQDAKLQGLDLSQCDLTHAHLSGAWLEKTRLGQAQLGDAIGEERAGDWEGARKGYLTLERHFEDMGDTDAASWAYLRKRRMQKWQALRQARDAQAARRWMPAADGYSNFVSDQLVEWLCDYGESIWRLLGSMVAVFLVFTALYGLTGSVIRVDKAPSGAEVRTPTYHPADLAVFSLLAMTTSGSPAVGLVPRSEFVHFMTGVQALLGIALTGLLGFVTGNLVRR